MRVPFYKHTLGEAELHKLAEVFEGEILTTGSYTAEFERRFAELTGRRHAIGLNSCTGALHLSLLALGIGPGDEVVTTPMSFVATALSILEAGATPVFVDVEADTGNLDPARIEAAVTPRTKAIMPVHLYGLLCDMRAIEAVARRHGLAVIEDAAHCVEGRRDGVGPGALGTTACFSFFATKNLNCGEGGAVATDDDALARELRLLSHHGMTKTAADRAREGYRHWDVVLPGWKYNLSNILAAVLLPQFDHVESRLAQRHELADAYGRRLAGLPGFRLPAVPEDAVHARHIFPIWVEDGRRDELVVALQDRQIGATVNYRAIHELSLFKERFGLARGDFPVAEAIGDATLSLPFYPGMPLEHVEIVASALEEILGETPAARRVG